MPGRMMGRKLRLLAHLPNRLKRYLVSHEFVIKHFAQPMLKENIGGHGQWDREKVLRPLLATHPGAGVDINYHREVHKNLPDYFPKVRNPILFVYGQNDPQKGTALHLQKHFEEVSEAGHNVFADQPEKLITLINQYLNR